MKRKNHICRVELLKELPGILNWTLEGTERILIDNKLECPYSTSDIKDIYEKSSDSVNSFIYNKINCEDDEGSVKKREVYKRYVEYCKENDLNVENQIAFGRRFFIITGCGGKKMGSIPAYAGVRFKDAKNEQKRIGEKESE